MSIDCDDVIYISIILPAAQTIEFEFLPPLTFVIRGT